MICQNKKRESDKTDSFFAGRKEGKDLQKVRATRHNGRTGSSGVFRAGHNDRTFDLDNAGHIDQTRCSRNVYWDCYQGLNFPNENGIRPERKFTFDEIELFYYTHQFRDSIEAQNERHLQSRHKERIRSVEDILKDPKTCPEETIYQLGTMDGHEDPNIFVQVFLELKDEIEKRFGSNIKILNWALHMDEGTPHIHERHVFFADDGHGMNFPKQDKACEALGFERPNPEKKSGKNNNRKMSFDAEIRRMYIEIAEKHGVTIEKIPLEGKEHLEKNDFIIAKQEEVKAANAIYIAEQELRISDIDSMAEEVAERAYEKACEVVTETVKEETVKADIDIVKDYRDVLTDPRRNAPDNQKNFIKKILDNVMERLARNTSVLLEKVKGILQRPDVKQKNQDEIAQVAKESIHDILNRNKKKAAEHNASIEKDYRERGRHYEII